MAACLACIARRAIALTLLFMSATCRSEDAVPPLDCRAEWALATRGIAIGNASDRVQLGAGGAARVWSEFKPFGVLRMLGVDPATREFVFDTHGKAQQRTEIRGGSGPETNHWSRQDDGAWQRQINGVADKRQSTEGRMVIDSTSFPYLLRMHLLVVEPAAYAVAVVAKGKVYPAELTVSRLAGEGAGFALDFKSQDGQGSARVDADLHPVDIEFTDEHGTLKGHLSHWECR